MDTIKKIEELLKKAKKIETEVYGEDNHVDGVATVANKGKQAWATRYFKQAKKLATESGMNQQEFIDVATRISIG